MRFVHYSFIFKSISFKAISSSFLSVDRGCLEQLFQYPLLGPVLMLKFAPVVLLELAHLVFFLKVFCYFLPLYL